MAAAGGAGRMWDAVVVGSGPNGLAAAVALARAGCSVLVVEQAQLPGGGTRTLESTLPGFWHDECSAIHPMAVLSPFFESLPLAEHGLRWLPFPVSVAHPLDDGPAVLLTRSVDDTTAQLGADAAAWRRMVAPFLDHPRDLFAGVLGPVRLLPRRPLQMARFGWIGLRAATAVARARFETARARALFAGNAAHSVLPLEWKTTAALGVLFAVSAHVVDWPCPAGGSRAIHAALLSVLRAAGGEIECGHPVRELADVPPSRVVLFDLAPTRFAEIAADALPPRYGRRLSRYRYGPGVFKVDWALDGPIPWRDPRVGDASTVHVGGSLEAIAAAERAAWAGEVCERPFLICCQQSRVDPTRAPPGCHTGYAYCHVPHGSDVDMTARIEAQIERFAPGFRDRIRARHTTAPRQFEALNPNLVGGAVTGGSAELRQLFTRPVARLDPYSTPHPRLYLCSASTPPGGGVHGMCGYHAAQSALRQLGRARRRR